MISAPITCGASHARIEVRPLARTLTGAAVALAVFAYLSAQSSPLKVERDGDRLRLSAPGLHFLAGSPLEQLHDGRSVTYVFTVSLQVQRSQARGTRLTRQVVFSYDLWEERFSVAQLDDLRTSASHLTAAAAEAWCLDLLSLPVRAAPVDDTFVLKLECSLREEGAQNADAPSATTFTGLIDLLSRKARAAPPHWEAVSLPMRLADLKDTAPK